jgi:hypothetical protein
MKKHLIYRTLDALQTEKPAFHKTSLSGVKRDYSIETQVLGWIIKNLPKEPRTIETGCGYSTIICALLAKEHIVISPFAEEHRSIKQWCFRHGVSLENVKFIKDNSQNAVPNLIYDQLDFILIDGSHAFPVPFIDWYYLADGLKKGGYLLIDDTYIPTCKALRAFLCKEGSRWEFIADIGKTTVFKRISEQNVARDINWSAQPYNLKLTYRVLHKTELGNKIRMFARKLLRL